MIKCKKKKKIGTILSRNDNLRDGSYQACKQTYRQRWEM